MSENFRNYIDSQDALFHYTKLSIAIEYILSKKKFKISRLKDGNDPREYEDRLFSGIGWELPDKEITKLRRECIVEIRRILEGCKRMSFCANRKPEIILKNGIPEEDKYAYSCGWRESRMWAQYADIHKGVCLVFSKQALIEEIKAKSALIECFNEYIQHTEKTRDPWQHLDINRVNAEGPEQYSINYIRENYTNLFFQKHSDFRDENEFRSIIIDPDNKLDHLDITKSIRGVIVGYRAPQVYLPLIKKLCQNIKISIVMLIYIRGNLLPSNNL